MPIDFTDILIDVTDLRQRVGGPSANPSSDSYVSDTHLQNVIDLVRDEGEEIVERKMETLSNEQILAMDSVFSEVSITVTAGSVVATGDIPADNLPVVMKAYINDGTHLENDNDIHTTGNIYTIDCGIIKYRYDIIGDKVLVLPNNTGTVIMHLPTKDEVRQILVADIISQMNNEIVDKARQMIRDRVATAQGFTSEAQTEAP